MDLDATKTNSWNDIQALQRETELLLKAVKSKIPNKKSLQSSLTKDPKGKSLKASTKKSKPKSKDEPSTTLSLYDKTINYIGRQTIEIEDDDSPDSTPRQGYQQNKSTPLKNNPSIVASNKQKELNARVMPFNDEKNRILSQLDTFIPAPGVTIDDIVKEKERLSKLQETSRTIHQFQETEISGRKKELLKHRMATRIQALFRGGVGRQKFALCKKIQELTSHSTTNNSNNPNNNVDSLDYGLTQPLRKVNSSSSASSSAIDWVEVRDEESGDIWYYNKLTGESQWDRPDELFSSLPPKNQVKKLPPNQSQSQSKLNLKVKREKSTYPNLEGEATDAESARASTSHSHSRSDHSLLLSSSTSNLPRSQTALGLSRMNPTFAASSPPALMSPNLNPSTSLPRSKSSGGSLMKASLGKLEVNIPNIPSGSRSQQQILPSLSMSPMQQPPRAQTSGGMKSGGGLNGTREIHSSSSSSRTQKSLMSSSLPSSAFASAISTATNREEERAALKEIHQIMGVDKLNSMESLIAPDGTFKPNLRSVVMDALLETRFDSISSVLGDSRWMDDPHLGKKTKERAQTANGGSRNTNTNTDSLTRVSTAGFDVSRKPMVSVMKINQSRPTTSGLEFGNVDYSDQQQQRERDLEGTLDRSDFEVTRIDHMKDLTMNNIEHRGFERTDNQTFDLNGKNTMCFGCWSAGGKRLCSLHEEGKKLKPSQTMLLCRNWELSVMRRRYRAEEIQEVFLKMKSSMRYDAYRKKFRTVYEQKHLIYRTISEHLEKFNFRSNLISRVKRWMGSFGNAVRCGLVRPTKTKEIAYKLRKKINIRNHSQVNHLTKNYLDQLPIPPTTGYSWAERTGEIQFLFTKSDAACGHDVDLILAYPIPAPISLYKLRKYHLMVPKSIPMPKPEYEENNKPVVLPGNVFIEENHPASWLERLLKVTVKDAIQFSEQQIKAMTPMSGAESLRRTKIPPLCSIKFATLGRKPVPSMLALGGLPIELLVYQLISTYFPPQYGNLMLMDKVSVSPGVSEEIFIKFLSLLMPPGKQEYVLRPLEHPLNYRKSPTVGLDSLIDDHDLHHFGMNRPDQTGEELSHGFRTSSYARHLLVYEEIDPQVFVPGVEVVSLNAPKSNTSRTTHADITYPFCEPSTRDNSTLDFYHLLLSSSISGSRAQLFTCLTYQEPGKFLKACDSTLPMGHLVVSVYRSWSFPQKDPIQEFKTDDGTSYWYNRSTGQTFWERPLFSEEGGSVLGGGMILDIDHLEEPMTTHKGEEGGQRRLLQGDARKMMLIHHESDKEATHRRRAAADSARIGRLKGYFPDPVLSQQNNNNNNNDQDNENEEEDEKTKKLSSYQKPKQETNLFQDDSSDLLSQTDSISSHYSTEQSIVGPPGQKSTNPYRNSGQQPPHHQSLPLVKGSRLDDDHMSHLSEEDESVGSRSSQGQQQHQQFHHAPQSPYPFMQQQHQQQQFEGNPMALANNMSDALGRMFSALQMNNNNNNTNNHNNQLQQNPQDLIQIGVGVGMALLQSGMMMQQQQPNQMMMMSSMPPQQDLLLGFDQGHARAPHTGGGGRGGGGGGGEASFFPVVSEKDLKKHQQHKSNQMENSRVSRSSASTDSHSLPEPIGQVFANNSTSTNKVIDRTDLNIQKQHYKHLSETPLTSDEIARVIRTVPDLAPNETPDQIQKVHFEEQALNADERVRQKVPVLIYPEISGVVVGGPPKESISRPAAGEGVSFVRPDNEKKQQFVSNSKAKFRRTVLPLPVGFAGAITAKHVATQEVDYLPQVPNLPQSRNIGRVKPRSAAQDWLAICFDPWSAGKNPLSSEFISNLNAKADKLLDGGAVKAAEAMEKLRNATVSEAFVTVEDREGINAQKAAVGKAQVQEQEFKRLCSYIRHNKFDEAEAMMNHPDWNIPIDYQDESGNTLLHISAQNGNKRFVKLSLRRGAPLNLQNLRGQTALHYAYGFGYSDVGDYLLKKGANDSIRNLDNLTCYEGLGSKELESM